MSEEKNLPPIPSGSDLQAKEEGAQLLPYWLDPTIDYPEPHFLLEYHGVGFSPLGGIQAISGQKKNGKTFMVSQLIAAILNEGGQRAVDMLSGLNARQSTVDFLGHQPKVLYVDTEMEQLNTAKVLRRVHWLCGWDEKKDNDRFKVLWLREVDSADERWRLIKVAIAAEKPDAVFIDGIRDCIKDFNDNSMASALVGELMKIASQNHICIWNVLHGNPTRQADGDENKMRGHLGTELGNKVSDTFLSIKKKTGEGVVFTVKQQDARGKDVEDWQFQVTDEAGALGVPRILTKWIEPELEKKEDVDWDRIANAIKTAIHPPSSMAYSDLQKALKTAEGIGSNKASKWIKLAVNEGLIERAINGKFTYNQGVADDLLNEAPF